MIIIKALIGYLMIMSALGTDEQCYGVMFDAGSSGTRVYVYDWDCRKIKEVPKIDITENAPDKKVKPGISAFADNIEGLSDYFQPLLEFASQQIPGNMKQYTPIMLGATAGMRILPKHDQNNILVEIRKIFKQSGFNFKEDSWARVITGQEEGGYMWLSINYLTGTLFDVKPSETANIIDLGGASTQLAMFNGKRIQKDFINFSLPEDDGDVEKIKMYSISYLYYGNDQAREVLTTKASDLKKNNKMIYMPCFNKGYKEHINGKIVIGTGKVSQCTRLIKQYLLGNKECSRYTYCGINGNYQPKIQKSQELYAVNGVFYASSFFGLSEFYVSDLKKKGVEICKLSYTQLTEQYKDKNDPYLAQRCFFTMYTSLLLKVGYKVPNNLKINSPSKINGVSPSWTLAGVFYQVSQQSCSDDSPVCQYAKQFFNAMEQQAIFQKDH